MYFFVVSITKFSEYILLKNKNKQKIAPLSVISVISLIYRVYFFTKFYFKSINIYYEIYRNCLKTMQSLYMTIILFILTKTVFLYFKYLIKIWIRLITKLPFAAKKNKIFLECQKRSWWSGIKNMFMPYFLNIVVEVTKYCIFWKI